MTRLGAALLAGVLLHLAYPRPGWDLLGWVALAPILALAVTAPSGGRAFAEGWVAGLGFFLPLLRWLVHTIAVYSTLPDPAAVVILAALGGYLALYWAAALWVLAGLRPRFGVAVLWLAPPVWVAAELARAHLLTGFPWGLLGYVPYQRLPVIQIAAWTGVYGVSFLVVLVNAALAWALLRRTRAAAVVAAAVIAAALGGTLAVGRTRLVAAPAPTLRVALVQGNIDQALKWDDAFKTETLRIYGDLTRQAAEGSRLVVWPEAAVPAFLTVEPGLVPWLARLSGAAGVPLLVGAPDARRAGTRTRYVNSAFLVEERGVLERYDKMHLVPFGEYVPLGRLLYFVEAIAAHVGDFAPGREHVVFSLAEARFGTVICYEVIFPDLFRRFVAEGADFMVNITNDAWFGDSGGPLQHLAMVPLRAVENGVAVARAANTGVSGLVLPSGAIGPTLGLFERGFRQVEIPRRVGRTFYTRVGDLFAYACAAVGAAAAGAAVLAAVRR